MNKTEEVFCGSVSYAFQERAASRSLNYRTEQGRLEKLAQAWAPKWDGRWRYLVRDGCFYHHDDHEVLPDHIFVFSVTPTRVYAYSEGDPFSHTRHQF